MNYGLGIREDGEGANYTLGGRMTVVSSGNIGGLGIVGFTPLAEPAPEGVVPEDAEIDSNFDLIFTDTKSIDVLIEGLRMAKAAMVAFEQGTKLRDALTMEDFEKLVVE